MSLAGPMLLDPRAFLGDEDVRMMTAEQAWTYLRLLMHQWEEGSIPACPERLSAILTEGPRRVTPSHLEGSLWPPLKGCFTEFVGGVGRLRNERLHADREAWSRKKHKAVKDGKKGGDERAKRMKQKEVTESKGPLSHPSRVPSSDPSATLQALPVPVPLPVLVPKDPPTGEEDRSAAPSIPAEWKPLRLRKGEDLALRALLDNPGRIDPEGLRAKKTEKRNLRTEWLHHLARLMQLELPSPNSEPWLDLWLAWRVKSRKKSGVAPQDDWDPQVAAFQELWTIADRTSPGVLHIDRGIQHFGLLVAEKRGWRGFKASWIYKEIDERKEAARPKRGSKPPASAALTEEEYRASDAWEAERGRLMDLRHAAGREFGEGSEQESDTETAIVEHAGRKPKGAT